MMRKRTKPAARSRGERQEEERRPHADDLVDDHDARVLEADAARHPRRGDDARRRTGSPPPPPGSPRAANAGPEEEEADGGAGRTRAIGE
jgi:hypothetical protein